MRQFSPLVAKPRPKHLSWYMYFANFICYIRTLSHYSFARFSRWKIHLCCDMFNRLFVSNQYKTYGVNFLKLFLEHIFNQNGQSAVSSHITYIVTANKTAKTIKNLLVKQNIQYTRKNYSIHNIVLSAKVNFKQ